MSAEKLKILKEYIKKGDVAILLEDIKKEAFEDAVVLDGDCSLDNFNGHYEGINFIPPKWYLELAKKKDYKILLLNNINKVSLEKQKHFVEIIKYRKISTFELPKNTIIILVCSDLKNYRLSSEIYSLVAQV